MAKLTDKQKHTIKTASDLLRLHGGQRYTRLADSLLGIVKSLESRQSTPTTDAPQAKGSGVDGGA